jgi:hypothetical protein
LTRPMRGIRLKPTQYLMSLLVISKAILAQG